MELTMNKVSKVLTIGDTIYINSSGKVIPSKCTDIERDGIETEHDFYGYDEHRKLWWLTDLAACKEITT